MTFEIVPTEFAAGAEIRGVNLAEPLCDNLLATLDRALGEYGVIFFRNQDLSPEQQMAVTLRFGELDLHLVLQYSSTDQAYQELARTAANGL